MATGSISNINVITPFQKGDTLTFGSYSGVFFAQTASASIIRIFMPLPKPVASGVTVKMYGTFSAKVAENKDVNFTIGSSSNPVTMTLTGNGAFYSYSASSNIFTQNCPVILEGRNGYSVIVNFT